MKSKGQLQHHPGQENKSGKATYASTTGVNSSTVQSTSGANFKPAVVEADLKLNSSKARDSRHGSIKISKQSK
jgi:hypothetical protein